MARKKNQIVEAEIGALSKDGHGLGHYLAGDETSRQIEVPFTRPGDRARALVLRKRNGVARSLLEEVSEPSRDRIVPRCRHFSKCGGCRWQHTAYEEQLSWKEESVRQALEGVDVESWHPILPSEPWHYRNKMEFTFSQDKEGNQYLGLLLQGSRGKVASLQECHIGPTWAAEAIEVTRRWWERTSLHAYFPPADRGSLRTLTIREGITSGDRMVILLVSGNPDYAVSQGDLQSFKEAMAELAPEVGELSLFLRIQQAVKGEATQFYEMPLGGPDHIREQLTVAGESYDLMVSPAAFFQPNTRQAELLYTRALELVEIPEDGMVYDLYCGTGTLGLFASQKAKKVVGIELSPESSLDARENAKANKRDNITVITGDVGRVLDERRGEQVDLVMVDPPRAGLDPKALGHLQRLAPKQILYISCNPKTQGANLRELEGYRVKQVQPIDQFPQTPHVENIVVLERVG